MEHHVVGARELKTRLGTFCGASVKGARSW